MAPRAVLVLLEWHSPARGQCQVSWLKPVSSCRKPTEEPERRIFLHLRILCFLDNTGFSEEGKRNVWFSWPIHEFYPRSWSVRKEFLYSSCFRAGEEQSTALQTGIFIWKQGSPLILSLRWDFQQSWSPLSYGKQPHKQAQTLLEGKALHHPQPSREKPNKGSGGSLFSSKENSKQAEAEESEQLGRRGNSQEEITRCSLPHSRFQTRIKQLSGFPWRGWSWAASDCGLLTPLQPSRLRAASRGKKTQRAFPPCWKMRGFLSNP